MTTALPRIGVQENLHFRVTRALALQVLEAERASRSLVFPVEAELCQQLGVSRTILRESVKVLADKGMVEVRQRSGTRAKPRSAWNQLDADVLEWWAELGPDLQFLRELSEVRLAIEPIAAGFAAVRAAPEEIAEIGRCLAIHETRWRVFNVTEAVDFSLNFHSAVVAASHNSLLEQLDRAIRSPLRTALSFITEIHASDVVDIATYQRMYEAIRKHDVMKARAVAEKIAGLAMLGVEEAIKAEAIRAEARSNLNESSELADVEK